jgi:hypothetical protein
MSKNFFVFFIKVGLIVAAFTLLVSLSVKSQPGIFLNSSISPGNNIPSDSPVRLINSNADKLFAFGSKDAGKIKNSGAIKTLSIKIVESQSFNVLHNQDLTWLAVCQNMGHTASIEPQTLLDNTDFFSSTDILIITSGVVEMPNNRRDIIQQYAEQGGPVYFQSEYDKNLTANQAFQTIVNNLGGSFSWGIMFTGELTPMNVSGVLSSIPNSIPTLSYFWYGSVGTGDGTCEPFLEYQDNYFGFIFTPPNNNYGSIISISDQDWAIQAEEKMLLMENIITYLSSLVTGVGEVAASSGKSAQLHQNYPNPFNNATEINYFLPEPGNVSLKIVDILGSEVQTVVAESQPAGEYSITCNLDRMPEGIYFCTLQVNSAAVSSIKMMLRK